MTSPPGADDPESARLAVASLQAGDEAVTSLGIRLVSVAPGSVVLAMEPGRELANGHGIVHGGILFALADTAFAYALASRGRPGVTTSATISFLAPARYGVELTARATEAHFDGVTGIYDVAVRDSAGTLFAAFRGQGRVPRGQAA